MTREAFAMLWCTKLKTNRSSTGITKLIAGMSSMIVTSTKAEAASRGGWVVFILGMFLVRPPRLAAAYR